MDAGPGSVAARLRGLPWMARNLSVPRRRRLRNFERFYAQFLRPGDLCVDVGANIGARVEVFLRLGARVVAVEPQPACVEVLRRRFGWTDRVTVLPVGLAEDSDRRTMRIASFDPVSSMSAGWLEAVAASGRFGPERWSARAEVEVTTLDAVIARFGPPAFCKIDVEGSEPAVLAGLSDPVPALSFEFTPECCDAAVACLRRLSELGDYEVNFSPGESMSWASPGWLSPAALQPLLAALPGPPLYGDVYARLGGGAAG